MTGFMLALAGLTCGDGGPGLGAAATPVAVSLGEGRWEGTWINSSGDSCRVTLWRRRLNATWGSTIIVGSTISFSADFVSDSRACVTWGAAGREYTFLSGPCRVGPQGVVLNLAMNPAPLYFKAGEKTLLVLRPAARASPSPPDASTAPNTSPLAARRTQALAFTVAPARRPR